MKTMLWGSGIFAAGFILHVLWWRISLPKRQTKTLLILMFAVLAAGLFFLRTQAAADELAHIALYVTSLILAYMITYSAVEADSPSLVIVLTLEKAGTRGLTEDELLALASDKVLIDPRLADLLTDKMAVLENNRYSLTGKGRFMAGLFETYRKIMGAGKGG